jgi:hypothetical protein
MMKLQVISSDSQRKINNCWGSPAENHFIYLARNDPTFGIVGGAFEQDIVD